MIKSALLFLIAFLGCLSPGVRLNPPERIFLKREARNHRIKIEEPLILSYRGIYLNWYAAKSLNKYIEDIRPTELNCVVIDFKNDIGFVTYNTNVDFAKKIGAVKPVLNIEEIVKTCNENGIYLIARIVVFKDSILAKYNGGKYAIRHRDGGIWRDKTGNLWVDQYSTAVWDYAIDIAKDLAKRGVREIQFDYIRFPSRGDMDAIVFSHRREYVAREDLIALFLREAYNSLKPYDVNVAVDLYGYTTWFESLKGEGQNLSKIEPYADVICPMLYPSHFHDDFKRNTNPREYHIVYESLLSGYRKTGEKKFVAYIQGFSYKSPNFGQKYIENQIKAVRDAKARGYIVWNARSDYSTLLNLLKSKEYRFF